MSRGSAINSIFICRRRDPQRVCYRHRQHAHRGSDPALPCLLRTTQAALSEFEEAWHIRFNEEETGLIAVIFGAWLMQKSDLHEKQVLLLTDDNPAIEEALEQQLRELTLLPLNIKYQSVERFQKEGAPKGVTLIVTPYATALPLFSPPLIHAENYFTERQQQHICAMLED